MDNGDERYGEGDELTISFDRATDEALLVTQARSGDEAFVNSLFDFSHALGNRFSGAWADASSFVITVINATDETVTQPADDFTVLPPPVNQAADGVTVQAVRATPRYKLAPIKTSAGRSTAASEPSPELTLRGAGVGNADAPAIVPGTGLLADDPDAGDASYGVGDTLTITLTARTNRGAYAGGKDFVDSLFSMVPPLGADYSGGWEDGSVFVITVLSAARLFQQYTGEYQTTPALLLDDRLVCGSFDRGAFVDFIDVDREFMIALNGVDFVRTQLTYKYYTQPYNITHMAPVTGGNKDGGTTITLFGRGFHEFEGKKTPRLARCRWTDGRTTDDTLAIYLSGSQLRCPTPSKPEPATHELLVSLNRLASIKTS